MTSKDVYLTASVMWHCGCNPIAYTLMWRRLRSPSVLHQIPITPVTIGVTAVTPVRAVRGLSNYIYSGLTMQAPIA